MSGVTISIDDLTEITQEIWSSYLDPEQACPLIPEPSGGAGEVSAAVSVTGAWRGHVVVECSAAASRYVAAALMGIESAEVTADDVADALGELANVIGGNVKSLLPAPSALSLPHVVIATRADGYWPAVNEICRLSASWQDEPVNISVLESTIAHRRASAPFTADTVREVLDPIVG
jgi:chemotaxis protein CheX